MSATCQNPSIEAFGTAPLWSWPAYLFQGNPVTATFLKVKAFLYAFKTKSTQPTPGPRDQEDPPQSADQDDCWAQREDYWNDPMLWMLMFH